MSAILIVLGLDCMGGVPVLDDFFTFLDENGSFSLNFSEIGLKLADGYEKIAAYFYIGAQPIKSVDRDDDAASTYFLISTWASSALE
ncbi:hypothetical protein Q4508_01535 [Amphritea sp. 2_MG-2023]|jgi:hypothetical protein|uniref:hypothetical protein n=1 Tax=Amphritea TaxID=515417 RepID=UPI001C06B60F|nr:MULTISPECIES: hypothetical protein [Amphritea]MBU2965677.1 hypothetical protein [Amphritea atlantica]MDO6417233.1 hypothetical protein [Amphritea sp. 2_MG-2023]MDX2423928.1 hypothetical protein [Amphritea sp.]